MRVSWRQAVRTGKNKGALIEDDGVLVDVHVPQSTQHLKNESLLLDDMASHLKAIASRDPRAHLNLHIAESYETGKLQSIILISGRYQGGRKDSLFVPGLWIYIASNEAKS